MDAYWWHRAAFYHRSVKKNTYKNSSDLWERPRTLCRIILTQRGRYTMKMGCAQSSLYNEWAQKGLGSRKQTGDQIIRRQVRGRTHRSLEFLYVFFLTERWQKAALCHQYASVAYKWGLKINGIVCCVDWWHRSAGIVAVCQRRPR